MPVVVEHAVIGFDKHTPNELGVKRFETLANEAERLGIKIAIENTEGEEYLERLLSCLNGHPAVGFCIDTGHEMCYNESRDLISKYARQLLCTHLNDNMKITGDEITWLDDSHMMPFDGLADWKKHRQAPERRTVSRRPHVRTGGKKPPGAPHARYLRRFGYECFSCSCP